METTVSTEDGLQSASGIARALGCRTSAEFWIILVAFVLAIADLLLIGFGPGRWRAFGILVAVGSYLAGFATLGVGGLLGVARAWAHRGRHAPRH